MKNISRLFSALLILFFLFPVSCDDGCGGFKQQTVEISGLSLETGTYFPNGSFSPANSISHQTASLNISVSDMQVESAMHNNTPSFSFANRAFACSPPPYNYTSLLSEIEVYSSDTIFFENETYPPGSDIGDLFYVIGDFEFTEEDMPFISEYIIFQNNDPFIFGEAGNSFNLILREFTEIQDQQITVRVALQDGQEFTMTTDEFEISN